MGILEFFLASPSADSWENSDRAQTPLFSLARVINEPETRTFRGAGRKKVVIFSVFIGAIRHFADSPVSDACLDLVRISPALNR